VSDPKRVDFKPKWPVTLPPQQEEAFNNFAGNGSLPTEPPRIDTCILPRETGDRVTLRSLSEITELTQKLADYAGYDVVHGPNPDFADLRSVSPDLARLTKLTGEPFAEGSFLIPARLEADPLEIKDAQTTRRITTDAVAQRFGEILTALDTQRSPTGVSIGALQTLGALSRVLRREASAIEFSTADSFAKPLVRFQVRQTFIEKVRVVLESRRPSEETLETLEGRVTALDVVQGTLLLTVPHTRTRIKGSFAPLFTPTLLDAFNRPVRVRGAVERKGRRIVSIHIHTVETPDAE
jgi:hypothetical protein